MNIDKTISPFAEGINFTDVPTLVKAFKQKAQAEDWNDKEIQFVVNQLQNMSLDGAMSLVLSHTLVVDAAPSDEADDKWSPFDKDEEDTDEPIGRDHDRDWEQDGEPEEIEG